MVYGETNNGSCISGTVTALFVRSSALGKSEYGRGLRDAASGVASAFRLGCFTLDCEANG